MYSNSECDAIPYQDALRVTNMSGTFNGKSDFNGGVSSFNNIRLTFYKAFAFNRKYRSIKFE